MTPLLVTLVLAAIIAGIILRNALHAVLLIALVLGVFWISCYAFDVSPRAILTSGVHQAQQVYKKHRYTEFAWL